MEHTTARKASDLARHELIGLRAEVLASGDPGLSGLRGRVVDETMRTLVLEVRGAPTREVTVPKRGQTFRFTLPDGSTQRLAGEDIAHRPEDRTKKAPRAGPGPRRGPPKVNHASA